MHLLSNKRLGKTELLIPPVVFGATSLGNLFKAPTDAEKHSIIEAQLRCGLSPCVIDSAGKYGAGLSLEVIGRELAALKVDPERVIISNKLAWRRVPLQGAEPTFEPGAWVDIRHDAVQDISYSGILRCWQEGNQLLQPYHAKLVSVHDPDEYLNAASCSTDRQRRLEDICEAYRALIELRDQGLVEGVGVGAKKWEIIQELYDHCDFDWVMLANSFTILEHPPELVEFMHRLHQKDVGVINSALFHGGFLLGGDFFDYRKLTNGECDRRRLAWRQRFHAVCQDLKVSPFDVGVAFGKSHPAITAVALSSSRADRVQSHVDAVCASCQPVVWHAMVQANLISAEYANSYLLNLA
ncbi:MAG: aldo/keto reductase [Planctomycetales bacterium]|nr:aldo/keto reductase [Planctomycetales bacterium]